tara:strand:+ start:120 stop:1097 length:978 start_codon:yes stop_codon:yes gene_type:complete
MRKKKVLICGATGFIGRNLLERFKDNEKYEVTALHHKRPIPKMYTNGKVGKKNNVHWTRANLTKAEDVKKIMKGIDIVLQYAATTTGAADIVSKPYIHVTDNAVMNSLLLREAFENKVKHFIIPSCSIMYQSSNKLVKETDLNESEEINPKYFGAGWMKVYLEKTCDFYSRFHRTKHTVLRQTNIYGPHDKYDLQKGHVFGSTIVKVMKAKKTVLVWGSGEEERDLLHVDDLVDCIEAAIKNQNTHYELVNVGLGQSTSISKLVKKVIDASGKNLSINYDNSKPTIKTKLGVDITKAKKLFNWTPKVSLDEGIVKTLNWYKKNVL